MTPPPPAGVPPKPTNDQWNVRRSTDGIYANVVSLPTVSPAISEVQVRLQIDTTTVTATLGTTLDNSYAKVLADDSSNWQTGIWSVAIRFKNNNGYGPYSDAKIVLVAIWEPTERTRNRTETDWVDTGRTQTDPVEDFDEKEQRRLVTYEQEEELRPNPDNEPNRWVLIREFEYQWVPIQDPPPPPLPPPSNVTASATHNSVTVSWDTVQGATGYVLQLGELEEDEEIGYVNYTTTQLTHTVGNLKSRTRYYYRVKSKNAGGEGSPSAVASLVTSAPPPPPLAGVPPKPTNDQWNVRRSTDGIYANVVSLPTVSPAISEVQVRLQIDTTTVTATLGTTLDNSYDKVLADDSSNWQTGEWSVSVRFKNGEDDEDYGPYSDVKTVLVANWVPTGSTQNRTETDWVDTGETQTDPVEDFDEKEQRRLVTYEQEEELRPNPDNEPNRWVLIREFEYRWVPIEAPPPRPVVTHRWRFDTYEGCGPNRDKIEECDNGHTLHTRRLDAPEPLVWTAFADVSPAVTRNRVEGQWRDTGNQRENQILLIFEKEQTLTTTWEKKQISTNQCRTTPREHWADASSTQTRWVIIPEVCGSWSDTGQTRVDRYGSWSRTGRTRGSGANKECQERRTVYREKQQSCTTNAPYNNTRYRWVSTSSTTATRWVDCPEEVWPSTWTDTGSIENFDAGTWRDLSTTQGCGPDRERKQSRIATWRKEQFQTSNLGNRRTQWVSASRISFQWRDYPEPLRWTEWTDTGQQRENQVLLIIEKEQERTSHCGDTQTRWVYVSG